MRYLVVTIEGGGNIPPVLHTIKTLVQRGHTVFLLSEPWFNELAAACGANFIAFREHFTKTDRNQDIMEDWKDRNNSFKNAIFGPAPVVARETFEAIRAHGIDALIADVLVPGALIAAEAAAIPRAMLFHMPEYLPGPNRAPGGLGIKPMHNTIGRLRDRLLGRIFHLVFDQYLPVMNSIRDTYQLPRIAHVSDLFHSADLRIIQTSPAFDFPILPAPANVRYTGPVLDDPDWTEPWQNPWPAGDQRPLVVVSLSTTFQNQQAVIGRCIDALGQLPVRGLVTLGPAMAAENFRAPENVRIVSNASHAQIFPHAACIITHAGHGTVMRALANGVPMVCLPMGRDKDDNAVKVAYHGAGLQLSPKATAAQISKAVSKILGNADYRDKAQKLGAQIRHDANSEALTAALDELGSKAATGHTAFTARQQ